MLTEAFIAIVLEKFVLPEMQRWFRDRVAAGTPPTEQDFLDKLRETTQGEALQRQLRFMIETEGQS